MKRICKKCQIEKELSDFYLNKNGKIKSLLCKICYCETFKNSKEKNKQYYENNKEMFKENYKEYVKENDRSEYMKKYREDHREETRSKSKEFRENNKELVKEQKKKYRDNLSPEKKAERNRKSRERYNKENLKYRNSKNKYFKKRFNSDPLFKLKMNIRSLIKNAFKRKFTTKSKKTMEILGCTFEELYKHLESKFDDKMNWENQGSYW